ncbi:MAG: hypothetical protein E3J88_00090 [Anaerolineales bacterium]|nr:MAG: hypothetical protein E3J88_00090 [Anaerolineales bacterium]
MVGEQDSENRIGRKRYVQLSLLVWVAMIGIDFFIHGGIFSATYLQDSPFLLSDMEAFRRIPLGYLALLATAGLLVWIMDRSSVRGWRKGLVVGLALGTVMGLSSALGLFSISTASPQLLAASFIAQVVGMATAGAIIGQGLLVHSLRRLTLAVVIGFVLLLVGTIVLQNIGLAPSRIAS